MTTAQSTRVVTYQLAYLTRVQVDLCAACVERDDHGMGVIGSVQHGLHDGDCEGCARKAARKLARQLFRDDLERAIVEGINNSRIQRSGAHAWDEWRRAASDACDRDTRDALDAVDYDAFVAAWEERYAEWAASQNA